MLWAVDTSIVNENVWLEIVSELVENDWMKVVEVYWLEVDYEVDRKHDEKEHVVDGD